MIFQLYHLSVQWWYSIRYNVIVARFEDCLIATLSTSTTEYLMEHLHTSIDGMIQSNWYRSSFGSPSISLMTGFFFLRFLFSCDFCLVCVFAIYLLFPMPLPINWWVFLIIVLEKFSNISSHTNDCLNTKGNEFNNFPFLYLINLSCFLCRLCPLEKKGLKIKFGIHMLIYFIVHYAECIFKKCITHYDCM